MPPRLARHVESNRERRAPLVAGLKGASAVAFVTAFLVGLLFGPKLLARHMHDGYGRVETTSIKLKRYVYEAYPAWRAAHPDRQCPHSLAELNDYANTNEVLDAWGRPIKLHCHGSLLLRSAGEDGRWHTGDDMVEHAELRPTVSAGSGGGE